MTQEIIPSPDWSPSSDPTIIPYDDEDDEDDDFDYDDEDDEDDEGDYNYVEHDESGRVTKIGFVGNDGTNWSLRQL